MFVTNRSENPYGIVVCVFLLGHGKEKKRGGIHFVELTWTNNKLNKCGLEHCAKCGLSVAMEYSSENNHKYENQQNRTRTTRPQKEALLSTIRGTMRETLYSYLTPPNGSDAVNNPPEYSSLSK
ncbi:hypothetical protein RUM44_006660 [Polyplax serrata]|uniref:Uncharacterized protein n=1 Tax=Polyplax serrata TaxID=468196 RepID=A0ABR1AIR4_POLSC